MLESWLRTYLPRALAPPLRGDRRRWAGDGRDPHLLGRDPGQERAAQPAPAGQCVAGQSVAREWVIVDTGSTDGTLELAHETADRLPYVRVLSVDGPDAPTRGGPIVRAFVAGIDALKSSPDVVVKLDGDVSLTPTTSSAAEDVRARSPPGHCQRPALEPNDGGWRAAFGTRSYVAGPARAYRWGCLQDVLPLEERRAGMRSTRSRRRCGTGGSARSQISFSDTIARRDGATGYLLSVASGSEARRISWATGGPTSSFVRSGAPFGIHERS